ncbi:MAG: hypothetical protein ACI9R3_006226 [Verrucomicrobiales bacterium]|jgi:hypothetical protein
MKWPLQLQLAQYYLKEQKQAPPPRRAHGYSRDRAFPAPPLPCLHPERPVSPPLGRHFLKRWCKSAKLSRIEPLRKVRPDGRCALGRNRSLTQRHHQRRR